MWKKGINRKDQERWYSSDSRTISHLRGFLGHFKPVPYDQKHDSLAPLYEGEKDHF